MDIDLEDLGLVIKLRNIINKKKSLKIYKKYNDKLIKRYRLLKKRKSKQFSENKAQKIINQKIDNIRRTLRENMTPEYRKEFNKFLLLKKLIKTSKKIRRKSKITNIWAH